MAKVNVLNQSNSNPNQQLSQRRYRSACGFTLVELLTVMGIIVILIGLLFAAMKYARNSAAQSRTKAQLDTLRGMLAELDSANSLSQSPPFWLWGDITTAGTRSHIVDGTTTWTTSSGTFTADFWKYPFSLTNSAAPPNPPNWDALDSPGDVGNDGDPQQAIQRNASLQILNTQLAMQLLAAIPGNRSAFDKLPANSKMTPIWSAGPVLQARTFGETLQGLLLEDGTDAKITQSSTYVQGIHVSYQGKHYVCQVTPSTAGYAPGSSPNWYDESVSPRGAPILLDGWSNPIIYVPATGLHVKLLNGQSSYLAADPASPAPTQEYIIISPEGAVSGQGTSNPVVTHIGRPFFASAGPDGDFTKGDDNLYSFNN